MQEYIEILAWSGILILLYIVTVLLEIGGL